MDSLKQKIWHDRLLAATWAACGILPLPFGAFASDKPYIASASILAFFILSFAVPLWLGHRRRHEGERGLYASAGGTLYGGAVVLLIAVGLLNGLTGWDCWHDYPVRVFLFTLWMFLTVIFQYLAGLAVDFWQQRLRKYWYSQFIDPILYSLPLPCAVLGMFLFPAVSDASVTQSLVVGIMALMGFCFIGMSLFVIAAFAFYFFPYKKYGYAAKQRLVHIAAIVVMVLMWALVQHILFDSRIHIFTYIFKAMPILQNNPLVFITPFVVAALTIIGCVAMRNVVISAFKA
ncbi:hypothetical protein [uncultured Megasphaera sp.]|uniref:hypothetical protein n=1 Tax=uncultured Megasphaera sp. TaxID=165188 RepID=UPI00286971E2|nr:hypothetical protein [uncultured Megasphaera sp.]